MSRSKWVTLVVVFALVFSNNFYSQSQAPKIIITQTRNADNSVDFNYTKEAIGSYVVDVNFAKLENTKTKSIPCVNASSDSGLLFTLKPVSKKKKIEFTYSYSLTPGFINPKIDSSVVYVLPFKKDNKVKIYDITRKDRSPAIWKTHLVYSNKPDTIYCMRKGIVVGINTLTTTSFDDVTQKNTTAYQEQIVVEHADGTFASYTSLNKKSIMVALGQKVYPQTKLGVMDKYNKDRFKFMFHIYYYQNGEKDGSNFRLNDRSVQPNFITQNGMEQLENKNEYVVSYDDNILNQELTEKEKKKFGITP